MSVDPRQCDPSVPCLPMVVPLNPKRDEVGHGRTLPLIGDTRNYVYDVVPHDRSVHIYADTPTDVCRHLIPGYSELLDAVTGSDDMAGEDALFVARTEFVKPWRIMLQAAENDAARENGMWAHLDAEHIEQATLSVDPGYVPTGVEVIETRDTAFGVVDIITGVWEAAAPKLVVDLADYYPYQATVELPRSELVIAEEDGFQIVPITDKPENMVILDSTTEERLISSLAEAGIITVSVYVPLMPDASYLAALRLGQQIAANDPTFDADDYTGWLLDDEPGTRHPDLPVHTHEHAHAHEHGHH